MDIEIFEALLNTINSPIVFVDNNHVICYLNKTAKERYFRKGGYTDLLGKSLFDCHNGESEKKVKEIYSRLLNGDDEVFLKVNDDNEKITVVAVRDDAGTLMGYYERFEKITGP